MELIHQILSWIHVPAGFLSLILFWIPVAVKKGSPKHRKIGWYYYVTMWIVLGSAFLLSISNVIRGNYLAAMYLGFLTIITAYPLWYSHEILQQKQNWSHTYFRIRKVFLAVLFLTSVAMLLLGALKYRFAGMGTMMVFFSLLGIPSGREFLYDRKKAMSRETWLKMHIQGTIISGIAAYTAFFAFGGSRIMIEVLHMNPQWMVIPWILPTLLGLTYSRFMKKKYKVA